MRARSFFFVAALVAALVLPSSAFAATPAVSFKFNAKKVKISGGSLGTAKTVFTAANRAELLGSGSVTFKAGRKSVRATQFEVTATPAGSQFSAKIGRVRTTLFFTKGPLTVDQATGAISSAALPLSIGGSARSAINKLLGLKGAKRLTSSKVGSATFVIAATPAPAPPAPPAPTPAPKAAITDAPAALIGSAEASFSFNADQEATFECSLDDGPYSACTSPHEETALADGDHTFRVRAQNVNGVGAPATAAFKVDTTAPTIEINGADGENRDSTLEVTIETDEPADLTCKLDNATATPCTSPHQIEGLKNGEYNFFTVTATDAAGNVGTYGIQINVHLDIELCGSITGDKTLSPTEATAYVVTCDLTIAPGAGLTIEPNTLVKFGAHTRLVVEGDLDVEGSEEASAVFTSIKDDTGGDSNGDGDSGHAEEGDWGGIVSRTGSDADISVTYGDFRFATDALKVQKGATDEVDFDVNFARFEHLSGDGVNYKVTGGENDPPAIKDLEFDENTIDGYPVVVSAPQIDQTQIGPAFAENDKAMLISGTIVGSGAFNTNHTIGTSGLTVAPEAMLEIPQGSQWIFAPGAALNVQGRLDANTESFQQSWFTSARGAVVHTPWEAGTPEAGDWRGIITGPGFDSTIDLRAVRIDYAINGVSSVKNATDFATLKLDDLDIRNTSGDGVDFLTGAGTVAAPAPSIQWVNVDHAGGLAFDIESPKIDQTKLSNLTHDSTKGSMRLAGTLVGDGPLGPGQTIPVGDDLDIAAGAVLEVTEGQTWKFARNTALTVNGTLESSGDFMEDRPLFTSERDDTGGDSTGDGDGSNPMAGDWRGIKAGTSGATIDLSWSEIRFAKNGIERPSSSGATEIGLRYSEIRDIENQGVRFIETSTENEPPRIENNNFENTIGADAVFISSPNIDQTRLGGNQANQANPLRLTGTLTGDGALPFGGDAKKVIDGLTVGAGATLYVMAPDNWYANPLKTLNVKGAMIVQSSDPETATFSSVGEGVGTNWGGIVVDGGTLSADRMVVTYAMTGIRVQNAGSATANYSSIHHGDTGLDLYGSSWAKFENGVLEGLNRGVRTDLTSNADARNNWWGTDTGPIPDGTGPSVQGNVLYSPWLLFAP